MPCNKQFTKKAEFVKIKKSGLGFGQVQFFGPQEKESMKKTLLGILFILPLFFGTGTARADDAVLRYEEKIFPVIKNEMLEGNFQEVIVILKRILTDDGLDHYEKVYLLEKNSELSKNMGYFKEAGEILELAYLINNLEKDLRIRIHDRLTAYYKNIRNWDKCINAHFYYLEHVKVDDAEKLAVLFDIVKNYQYAMQYKKAERVLSEVIGLCQSDADFAYLYYYRGIGCFALNEYGKAVNMFKKALKYNELTEEEQGIALYNAAFCLEILQDREEAVKYYEKALPVYANKALVKNRLEKLTEKAEKK